MRQRQTLIGIPIAVIVLMGCVVIGIRKHSAEVREQILSQNFPAVLDGCRFLMSNKTLLIDDWDEKRVVHQDAIVLDPKIRPFDSNVTEAIKKIAPYYIAVYDDHVFMNMGTAPRNGIIAFTPNTPQYGSKQLIDGLWLWTGSTK